MPVSVDILIVFGLIAVAIVLFAWERVSFDVTALIIMATLLLTGILTPQEGLAGFSNAATVTIGAMFVLSEGLRQTGALRAVGVQFARLGRHSYWLALTGMMLTVGLISAFINNTAAVAIFIPVVINVADRLGVSASKLLMPLSFASMFGGVCTLIGTSTNILVSSIAADHGIPGFSMFEFAPLGLIFFAAGTGYMLTLGMRLVPERRAPDSLTATYRMDDHLADVLLEPSFAGLGKTLEDTPLTKNLDLDVLSVYREDGEPGIPPTQPLAPQHPPKISATGAPASATRKQQREHGVDARLEAGDVLRIRGNAQEVERLLQQEGLTLMPPHEWYDNDLEGGPDALIEVVVAPDAPLTGRTIRDVDFRARFGAILLAMRRRGRLRQDDLMSRRLAGGDSLLLMMDRRRIREIEQDPSFMLTSARGVSPHRPRRLAPALLILIGVVGAAALGLVPIVVSALAGCVLMVLVGCLTPQEAYDAINWKIIFLLAGVLPLGTAMDKTGAADLLSTTILSGLGDLGPVAVCSGFFFLSMMLTNVVSNQATAALLAPIAIQTAAMLGVSARPLLVAVTFAASLSFMTPVGYQTNTMIYGPGQYRFTDFTRVGTPLNLLFWIIGTLMIPLIWPF